MDRRAGPGAAEHQQDPEQAGAGGEHEGGDGETPLRALRAPPAEAGEEHRQRADQEKAEERQQREEAREAQGDDRAADAPGAKALVGFAQRLAHFPGADQLGDVAPLVLERAAEPRFAVAVDDRLERAAVVDLERASELPLDQPVAGRVGVLLVGRPGRQQRHRDQRRDPQPAPVRQPPDGAQHQQRHEEEDARAVGQHRQRAERGEKCRHGGPAAPERPVLREHDRQRRQHEGGGDQLRPDEEAVDDDDVGEQGGADRQSPHERPQAGRAEQRPEADHPELLEHDSEHLVVEIPLAAEGALVEDIADLQRRPVAGEPVGERRRRAVVAVDVEPVGEEARDRVVGRQLLGEPGPGHLQRFGAAAVEEAEVEDEAAGQGPERQRREQWAQGAAVDAVEPDPGAAGERAEDDQEGEAFAEQRRRVEGPEAEHRDAARSGQGDGEQKRHAAQAQAHGEQGGENGWKPGQQQMLGEHPPQFGRRSQSDPAIRTPGMAGQLASAVKPRLGDGTPARLRRNV